MNRIAPVFLLLVVAALCSGEAFGQLSGTKTIDPSGSGANNYVSVTAAINDLNTVGVGSGGVTFDVAAGVTFTETLPALTATGTAANPIVFQKSGAGSNPKIVPASYGNKMPSSLGNNGDAIWRIVGSDYLTIDGIDLKDDTVSFTQNWARYDYGYLLVKASAANACKFVTIRNCTIELTRTNDRSAGIYVSNMLNSYSSSTNDTSATGVTVTTQDGRHEGVKIYGNTIFNVQAGIYLRGYAHGASPYHLYDHFIEIGKDGGNTIHTFGYGPSFQTYGIYAIYQDSLTVAHNTLTGGQLAATTTYGIMISTGVTSSAEISDNTVTMQTTRITSSQIAAIYSSIGESGTATAPSTVAVVNNKVVNGTLTGVTSSAFYGIYFTATAVNVAITGNNILANAYGGTPASTATGTFYAIYHTGSTTVTGSTWNVANNWIGGNTRAQSSLGSGTFYGIYSSAAGNTLNVNGNVIGNNTVTSTGTTACIYATSSNATKNFYDNRLDTLLGGATVYGLYTSSGTTVAITRNRIAYQSANSATTTASAYGVYVSSGTTVNLYNNMVSDIRTPVSTNNPAVYGVYFSTPTTVNCYFNAVHLDAASSSSTTFGSAALYASTSPALDMQNNILINKSAVGPTGGFAVAFRRSSTTLTSYASTSNYNDFHAGTPSSTRLIFYDGTNADQDIASYKARVTPRDGSSFSEDPPFANTATKPYDLHLSGTAATQCESGGVRVTTPIAVTADMDGELRWGEAGYGGLGTAPDVGADEGNYVFLDLTPPNISYTQLTTGPVTATRAFTGVVITDASGVLVNPGVRPRVYYKKAAHANAWNDNTPATDGWKWVEAGGMASPFGFTIDYAKLYGGAGVALGDSIQYFVVAQDSSGAGNVGIYSGSFASTPSSVAITAAACPVGGTIFKYAIGGSISDTISVGAGGRLAKLKTAFDFVNASVVTGDIVIRVVGPCVEDTTAELLALNVDPSTAAYSLKVVPVGAQSVASTHPMAGSALIKFTNADRATIDGINAGGDALALTVNDSTKSTAVVWLSSAGVGQGATSDTIRNCTISGALRQNLSSTVTIGIFQGGASVGVTGTGYDNDNNVFSGNAFTRLRYGIVSAGGSASNPNLATRITGNVVGPAVFGEDQIGKGGIVVYNEQNGVIAGNEVRCVGQLVGDTPSSTDRVGIALTTDASWAPTSTYVKNVQVLRNLVHDIVDQKNSFSAAGIVLAGADGANATSNVVANNMVYNILMNGTTPDRAVGIGADYGNGDIIAYNTVNLTGDLDPAGVTGTTMNAYAYMVNSSSAVNLTLKNNIGVVDVSSNTATTYHAPVYIPATTYAWGTGGLSNNDWYYPVANVQSRTGSAGGTFYTSLSAWRAAVAADANSFEVDPFFTSPQDLHIASGATRSALESSAAAITGVTEDYDQQTRPGGGGTSNGGGTAPDIGADEFDGAPEIPMVYVSSTVTQNTAPVYPGTTGNQVIGVRVVTQGLLQTLRATRFNFTSAGTTSSGDIANAKLWYTGKVPVFSTATQYGATVAAPGAAFVFTDTTKYLATDTSYFWLTFDVLAGALPGHLVDAACDSLVVADTARVPSPTAPSGARTVAGPLAGTYTVGSGGAYPSLVEAFTAANTLGLMGDVTFAITSDIAQATGAVLNQWVEYPPNSNFSMRIVPSGGAWTVSGPMPSGGLIRLAGADRVRIDGLNSGGNALTLRNTDSTAANAVVWLTSAGAGQGATNDTVANCTITGGPAMHTSAIITFGILQGGGSIGITNPGHDNDGNVFSGNTITRVRYGIVSQGGSSSNPGTGLRVTNNLIGPASPGADQICKAGILLYSETGALIADNEVRNIVNLAGDATTTSDVGGICVSMDAVWSPSSTTVTNTSIVRNRIHDIASEKTYSAIGILLAAFDAGNVTANLVANNMVYAVRANGTGGDQAVGIGLGAGNQDRVVYNSVFMDGDLDPGSTTSASIGSFCYIVNSASVISPVIRNNIAYMDVSSNTSTVYHGCVYVPANYAWGSGVMDNNDWHYNAANAQARLGSVGGSLHTALSSWRGAVNQDFASISVNPTFTSSTDLHIASGATPNGIESAGAAIAGVAVDYDQQTRPGGGGTSNGGGTAPDIGADEYDGAPVDLVPPAISFTPLGGSTSTTSRSFTGIAVTDPSGVNGTAGTRPRVYYKKYGNANAWNDNTSATDGWKWVEANGSTSPFDATIDYAKISGGTVSSGDIIQYFVVAQDNASTPNAGMLQGGFAAQPSSVALTSAAFPISGTIYSYTIAASTISGAVSVPGTYPSLTGAGGLFADINAKVVTGNITVSITDSLTEDGTYALNQWSEDPPGSNFTLTIQPSAAVERVIYGAPSSGMIRLSGADRVTIDGRSGGGGRYLRFVGNTTSYPVITLLNDACNNTIRNCIIEGANATAAAGLLNLTESSTTGNSNNTITANLFRGLFYVAGGAVPATCLYSGTSTTGVPANANNAVTANEFSAFTGIGVWLATVRTGNAWTIENNSFYQTAARTTKLTAIQTDAGEGHSIRYNSIGGADAWRGGAAMSSSYATSPAFVGIQVAGGTAATTTVQGNVIGNVAATAAGLYGIYTTAGNLAIAGNRLGSNAAGSDTLFAATAASYGIYNTGNGTVAVTADTVGYLQSNNAVYGIYLTGGAATVADNLVTHTSAGSTSYGIYYSGGNSSTFTNNLVTGMSGTSSTIGGIYFTSSGGTNTLSGNTVTGLANGTTIYGMYHTGTLANMTVTGNTVQNLTATSGTTSATLYGIYCTASGTQAISGNTVTNLTNSTAVSGGLYGIYTGTTTQTSTVAGNAVTNLVNNGLQGSIRAMYIAAGGLNIVTSNTIGNCVCTRFGSNYGLNLVGGVVAAQGNTIHNLVTPWDSVANTFSLLGMTLQMTTAGNLATQNTIFNLTNSSARDSATVIGGIYVGGPASAVISRNRVWDLQAGGGLAYRSAQMYGIYNQTSGATVYSNNMVSIGDSVGSRVRVAAAEDVDQTTTAEWYYNSFFVTGANPGADTTNSHAYSRRGLSTPTLRNNLLYNMRTGGAGRHYAIGNWRNDPAAPASYLSGWTASSSDYNLLVTADSTAVGEWGPWGLAAARNLTAWKDSAGDGTSLYATTAEAPASLFTAPVQADLTVDASNPACWYANGNGIAGSASASIADDFGATGVRSTTLGMATDIGADEFTTTATPPQLAEQGSIGTTSTYWFGGRRIARIVWGSAVSYPNAIDGRFRPGDNPPGTLMGQYSNGWWNFSAAGGSGYSYDLTLYYTPAFLGTISPEASTRMAKRDGGAWSAYNGMSGCFLDAAARAVTTAGLTSFSDFALSDSAAPLPVELAAFSARLRGAAVELAWTTASELNTARFVVERRAGEGARAADRAWTAVGAVDAQGSVDRATQYAFADAPLPASAELDYRLRIEHRDGSDAYSPVLRVSLARPAGFALHPNYPNPFNPSTTMSFTIPEDGVVSLRVYDARGREVATLLDGALAAGTHAVPFQAGSLPSGVYRCELRAGGRMASRAVVLAK